MATTTNNGSGEACDNMLIGYFYFIDINLWPNATATASGELRHGQVLIFGFQDIPGGLDLYLTDRAWGEDGNGTEGFVPNLLGEEGIVKFTTPSFGVPAGVAFGVGSDTLAYKYGDEWIDIDVNATQAESSGNITSENNETHYFDLGSDGDQVFLYCVGSDGKDRPVAGISYNGPFEKSESYGTNKSSAPDYFEDYDNSSVMNKTTLLVMPTIARGKERNKIFKQWSYVGPMKLNFYDLQDAIRDTEKNWIGTNPDMTRSKSGAYSPIDRTLVVPNAIALLLFCFLVLK